MTKTCAVCGKEFIKESRCQKICSDECRKVSKKIYDIRHKNKKKEPRECRTCGKMFLPTAKTQFCSDECRKASVRASWKAHKDRNRIIKKYHIVKCPRCQQTRKAKGNFDRAARVYCESCLAIVQRYAA